MHPGSCSATAKCTCFLVQRALLPARRLALFETSTHPPCDSATLAHHLFSIRRSSLECAPTWRACPTASVGELFSALSHLGDRATNTGKKPNLQTNRSGALVLARLVDEAVPRLSSNASNNEAHFDRICRQPAVQSCQSSDSDATAKLACVACSRADSPLASC